MKKKTERAHREIQDVLYDFFVYPEKYPVVHLIVVTVLSIVMSLLALLIYQNYIAH